MFGNRIHYALLAIALGVGLGSGEAGAHAIVLDASPAANEDVASAEVGISLRFNSRVDHRRSRLTLVAPDGTLLPLVIDAASAPDTLAARATRLQPGPYRVRWQVLAVDGHITRGDIPFTVRRH